MDQLSDYHTDYIRELIRTGKARVSRVGDLQFSNSGQYAMPTNQSVPPPRQPLVYDLAVKVLYDGMSYQDAADVLLLGSKQPAGTTQQDAMSQVRAAARDMISPAEWRAMHPV